MLIAGVDEVGRGPLAGPVVASALILEDEAILSLMKDSKKLSDKQRDKLYDVIVENACWSVAFATVEEIDRINILQASLLAMKRAIESLKTQPSKVWVDGIHAPKISIPAECYVKGDERFPVISAASIVAKVTRDRYMIELAKKYPQYGFDIHKGYPTAKHLDALKQFGPTEVHRLTFKPVMKLLQSHV
jgi:ribonuclease HII